MILELKDGSKVFVGSVPQTKLDILYDVVQQTLDHEFILSDEETLCVVSWMDRHTPDSAVSEYLDGINSIEGDFLGGNIRSSDVYYDSLAEHNVSFIEAQLYRPGWAEIEQEEIELLHLDAMFDGVTL